MIAILLLVQVLIIAASQQLTISFNDGFDDFEEGQFFSLAVGEKLAIELNELEEDAFDEGFRLLTAAFLIKQCHQTIENESCRYEVITEIDEF